MITSPVWKKIIATENKKPYMIQLSQHLLNDYQEQTVYPEYENILRALELTSFENVKVVILGQDPYHGSGQAQGLSFSVPNGMKIPPSLRNIFKELSTDLQINLPTKTDLTSWAKQGVLLLNTTLTVLAKTPLSHAKLGWETLTDEILRHINEEKDAVVFILWGAHAQKKALFIDHEKHLVIKAPHPSPLAAHRGFFGSRPFSKTNEFLISRDLQPIDWEL